MRGERKQHLKDFDDAVGGRLASGIARAEIHIRIQDWEATFKKALGNDVTLNLDDILKKGWDAMTKSSKSFVKKRQVIRGRQSFKTMGHRAHIYNKKLIKISMVGVPMKTAGKGRQKLRAAGEPSVNWVDNAVKQYKAHLKKEVNKTFKMPNRIEAEHGTLPEGEQMKGDPFLFQAQKRSGTLDLQNRPGALGNNASNAVIQALKKSITRGDAFISIFVELGQSFFNERFLESKVTKRKSAEKFIAEAKTSLVLIPNTSPGNKGLLDTKDIAAFREQLKEGSEAFMAQFKNLAHYETMLATSPKISDEVIDYGIKGITEKMIKSAGFRLTKTGAIDRRSKGITKKGGFDMRFKFNQELQKKVSKQKERVKNTETLRTKVSETKRRKTLRKATGVAVASRKPVANRAQGDRNVQAIALKDIINATLTSVVAGNMGSPALNYRTGRFASSARVESVLLGPRGGLSIDYTYMLFPYQTFEPGFAQGSTLRDPRKLIGQSIRGIVAANMQGMQPLLRRV